MTVADVMTTDLVTAAREEPLQAAVSRMLDHGVGSVLVVADEDLVGLVTETDVLAMGTSFERPFEELTVSRAMSTNLVTTTPETPIEDAVGTLRDHGVKKLPVLDEGDLVGVLTLTDVVYHRVEDEETRSLLAVRTPTLGSEP
ncbi:MAG: CBS domain-containing protein [Halanaeroarchaeum sp.]